MSRVSITPPFEREREQSSTTSERGKGLKFDTKIHGERRAPSGEKHPRKHDTSFHLEIEEKVWWQVWGKDPKLHLVRILLQEHFFPWHLEEELAKPCPAGWKKEAPRGRSRKEGRRRVKQ